MEQLAFQTYSFRNLLRDRRMKSYALPCKLVRVLVADGVAPLGGASVAGLRIYVAFDLAVVLMRAAALNLYPHS